MERNMQPGTTQRERPLQGERRANTEAQLLQNLLTEGVIDKDDEIDDYMATSFLDNDELAVIRDQQELLSRLRRVATMLGYSEEEWQNSPARKELVRRMVTIGQTSKSKGGVGIKTVRTEKIVQEESLYQTHEAEGDEQGAFDKIMEKVGGSGIGGQAVVGNPNLGTYGRDPGKW